MNSRHVARFGTFEFDFESGELWGNGRKLALQSQPAQVLSLLLRRPGELVTREELRRLIWADDTFVDFDPALNVSVNKVRLALGDSAAAPRFVETVPKRGYRFLADVRVVDPAGGDDRKPALPAAGASRYPVAKWLAAASLVLALLAVFIFGQASGPDASPRIPRSIAVLPFRPLVAEAGDEALEVALAEAVIVKLGQLKELRVPSINAVQRYARRDVDPRDAGRQLDVDVVLDASVLRQHDTVRLSARLIEVEKGATVWAQQWDLPWTDILTVQDTLAAAVVRALVVNLGAAGQASLGRHPTNVAAYESYLRARYLLIRRTVADSKRAAELLEDAVARDPGSAAAHASLAFAYISVPLGEGPSTPYVERGRRAATRAIELDPTIAEAHAVLARIAVHFDWDTEARDRWARRALELDPDDPFVLHCYSLMLADDGRFDEALTLARRALSLDPASVLANRDLSMILFLARRYEECAEQCRRTLELDPYSAAAYSFLGRANEQLHRADEAVEAYVTPFTFSEKYRDMVQALRSAAARDGLKGFWKLAIEYYLAEPEPRVAAIAAAYVGSGDHESALRWLERLYAERGAWIRGLKVSPVWDPLRGDPRFQDLLRRARLVPEDTQPTALSLSGVRGPRPGS
jgi:TolB-like protein/DNA-binding winged helix-turn-helix (wHTH) protein/Tfp pilus assembly protein PilF